MFYLTSPFIRLVLKDGRERVDIISCKITLHSCFDLLEFEECGIEVSPDKEHFSLQFIGTKDDVHALHYVRS